LSQSRHEALPISLCSIVVLSISRMYPMNSLKHSLIVLVSTAFVLAGCGGGGSNSPGGAAQGEQTAATQEPAGSASITGTINFTGTAPAPQRLNLDRE